MPVIFKVRVKTGWKTGESVKVLVAQSCSTVLRPHGLYSLPGASVHGILQARILEWSALPSSRRSSKYSHTAGYGFRTQGDSVYKVDLSPEKSDLAGLGTMVRGGFSDCRDSSEKSMGKNHG